jgi:hypothetical protein
VAADAKHRRLQSAASPDRRRGGHRDLCRPGNLTARDAPPREAPVERLNLRPDGGRHGPAVRPTLCSTPRATSTPRQRFLRNTANTASVVSISVTGCGPHPLTSIAPKLSSGLPGGRSGFGSATSVTTSRRHEGGPRRNLRHGNPDVELAENTQGRGFPVTGMNPRPCGRSHRASGLHLPQRDLHGLRVARSVLVGHRDVVTGDWTARRQPGPPGRRSPGRRSW